MRAVIQRVTESSVTVEGKVTGQIGAGMMVLLGIDTEDTEADADTIIKKLPQLRIFNDEEGKFNRSLIDINGSILLISQFTLYGDARKGNRPSFIHAARPEQAIPLYEYVIDGLRKRNITVETGRFGAHMDVQLINDGPVTILLDSQKNF